MFDIGFFELLIILGIAVMVVGPENLPRLARSLGKGWGEFQNTFSELKQEVMDETENVKKTANLEEIEQEISAATKVDVDVNLDLNEGNEIKPGIAGAADFSMTYKAPVTFTKNKSEFTLGVAVSNLGSKITYTNSINRDYIPTNLGLGLAWKFNLDEFNTLTFTSDFNKLLVPTPRPEIDEDGDKIPDYKQYSSIRGVFKSFGDAPGGFSEELKEITIGGGAEYWYDDQFAVRAGYFYEHYSKGNRKYFSVGLGVKYNIFGLNFSYLVPTTNQRNPLDNTLRFSLLFDFDAFDSETN